MSNVQAFLRARTFAVAGASRDRAKYGNKVFLALVASGRQVAPINPSAGEIEGRRSFPSIHEMEEVPEAVSIVTPPTVTRDIVRQAIATGVQHIWMQPGAEDPEASQLAREAGLNVIDDGSCILVSLAIER